MKSFSLALALAALVPSLAKADPVLLAFEGGIGVDPVAGVTSTGSPALNVVRGVSPGGFTWKISRLSAQVQADGRITVDGRGLLLTAGNAIGTNGGQRVFATLFCGPAATATGHSSSVAGAAIRRFPQRRRSHAGATGGLRQPRVAHHQRRERTLVRRRHSEERHRGSLRQWRAGARHAPARKFPRRINHSAFRSPAPEKERTCIRPCS